MKKELLLLILAGLLSLILIRFDLQNGFEYLRFEFNFAPIDFAVKSSTDDFLTTQILAYLIFVIYIASIKKQLIIKSPIAFWIFMILLFIGIYIETIAIYENIVGEFSGRHCRIGNILTTMGIVFYVSNERFKKNHSD